MPKTKTAVKDMKQKLTAAERSQIAKDNWEKRRGNFNDAIAKVVWDKVAPTVKVEIDREVRITEVTVSNADPYSDKDVISVIGSTTPVPVPEQPTVAPESGIDNGMSGEPVNMASFRPAPSIMSVPYDPNATAQQLVPVAPKKQKRYTGPKEFSVALKAAESRLAKAIVERAQASGQLAMLQAEIPSLIQIINALKGQQNVPAVPYDLSGAFNPQQAFQAPAPHQYAAPSNPLAAIQAAMTAPPVSRASGGAMQFGPDVVGSLEGPEDDDIDKFITGPAAAGGGWIGG